MLTGQCPIKYVLFLFERKNIIPHWAFRVNSSPADSRNLACKNQYAKLTWNLDYMLLKGPLKINLKSWIWKLDSL